MRIVIDRLRIAVRSCVKQSPALKEISFSDRQPLEIDSSGGYEFLSIWPGRIAGELIAGVKPARENS